tara:strand:+ start:134 stop:310 length:177 start_codon:yes stop_codon:yes gene_type:complete
MLENISQEQFEHIINLLILYKQLNPNKDVYLSESSVKNAIKFMSTAGKEFADKLGLSE